MVSRYWLE